MIERQHIDRFAALFDGLPSAFGTGSGCWVKRPLALVDWSQHLRGVGTGIGVAPLRPDSTVMFAAIDLDEPDFDAADEMRDFIPGVSFIERSRSGNAHVWVFFKQPLEAWVAMGILKEATLAAGKEHVEVFPKNHDFTRVKLGNYINLPYHGDSRPVLCGVGHLDERAMTLPEFLEAAESARQDPEDWRKRAMWLQIHDPAEREARNEAQFGTQQNLHICAEHIIGNAETNPIVEGHRAAVYFALAKQLSNWALVDSDEALMMMQSVNDASPDPIPDSELRRILGNAERGMFTSTGCDDPLVAPYAHPDCPIANPKR